MVVKAKSSIKTTKAKPIELGFCPKAFPVKDDKEPDELFKK